MDKVEQQLSNGNLLNNYNQINLLQNVITSPLNDYSFLKSSVTYNYEAQSQSISLPAPTTKNSSVSIAAFNLTSNRKFTIRTEGTFTDNPGGDFDGNPLNPNDDVFIYAGSGFTINGNPTLPVIRDASGNPIRDSLGKQVLVENAIAVAAGYSIINAPNQQYSNLVPPFIVERQVIEVPIYEELKQQELNSRISANTTTSTFNIQQNPINNAADWERLFPNTGTESNPNVIRVTGGGLNIPSQIIQSNTVIIVEQGDINLNGSGHDFTNVVLIANNGNINLNNIRSSNLSVLASGSINTNSEARFGGASLLAAGSPTGTINFNGATNTITEADKLRVISQGDITYNSTVDTRGEFISGKNFTANSNSIIIGGIDAKGNIIFNGQVTVIGADTTDNVKNQAPEIFTQPETEYTILRNSALQITSIPLTTTQPGLASIQGQAFLDINRDGKRSSEPGIDGFVVELVNSVTGEVVAQQITRSVDLNGDSKINPFTEQGLYKFANLQPGSYQIRQVGKDGWNLTSPFNIALVSGEQKTGVNFGNIQNYLYQVGATDPEGDTLTYSLVSAPAGATIDATTGKLIWTPDAIGEYVFKVKVADGKGGEDIQEFKLNVLDPNRLPSISSNPIANATVGQNYTYQIIADNPDLDGLNFQLNQAPPGMSISPDGLIQWTPQANQIGAQQVKLLVKDDRGGEVEQVFTILTQGSSANPQPSGNYAPVITSKPITTTPRQQYTYDVDAIDPDNDVLKYSLVAAPQGMTIDQNTGLISWNPGTQTAGNYNINVRVEDNKGSFDNQAFTLALSNTVPGRISGIVWDDLNGNGVRDSSFAQGANPDVVFILDVSFSADDPFQGSPVGDLNGDRQANTILDAEIAAFIALNQQLIRQGLGDTARVSVIDFAGSASSRDMIPNLAGKQLVTNPAADKDNNGILDVEQVLRGLRTGPFTNFEVALKEAENVFKTIGTTPGNGTLVFLSDGENTIGGAITDELNNLKALGVKSYAFGVGEGAKLNDGDRLADDLVLIDPNAKIFKNTDELLGTFNDLGGGSSVAEPGLAGARVYLDLNNNAAFDVDEPNQITTTTGQYQFTGLLPGNYTVRQIAPNGFAQTFPTATASTLGSYAVNLGASEIVENRNFGNQSTTPKPNRQPNFISAPSTDAQIGRLFRYEATATDPDSDTLTYKLVTKPTGMAIDSERGVLVWQPAADQIGNFDVVLQVEDGKGGSATQSFQIKVGDGVDRELPVVNLGFTSNVVQIGESVTFNISATDNNGIENIALTIDGNPVTLNAGSATVQLNKAGVFQVTASATDAAGNIVKKDLSLRVLDPNDTTGPTVEIISPQTNKTITNLTDIVGSISDENLEFYRVDYAPLDLVDINNIAANDPDFVTISEGKTNVNKAVIGQFDPTVLFNGNYVLRVTAQDFSGNINSRGVFLGVSGDKKLGNFRLELTDLSIPLAGIPIQINRVYDTLQSSFSGDFGFGWSLGVKDAKIQESVPVTEAEKQGVPSIFGANPFTAGTKVYLTNPEGRRVGFTFDPVVAGASLLGAFWKPRFVADPGVYDKLEVDDINLQQRSDGSFSLFFIPFAYNPSEYKLTTKDGTTYDYDQFKGLQEIKDRNNNTLTFKDNGIFSSTGASVDFLRDTKGRITQIKDPTGKAIVYGYDARGNLVSVTDRNNNSTQFVYNNPNRPSFLTEIIDPLGRKGVRTEYDDKGRLARIIDGNGNVTNLGFDTNGSVQTITDALGNPTTLIYDNRGNIVSEINALSGLTQRTYDANNNLLSVKDPLGNTATYTYDSRGNLLSETNGLNQTTIYTYNNLNKVVTVTDRLGNTTQNSYDSQGNLLTTTDAAGKITTYVYNSQGNVTSVTNPQRDVTQYEYDSQGRITAIINALNQKSQLTYDNNGNLVSTTTPLGNTTRFTYDSENRPASVTDALGNISRIEYNASGDRTATIDALGRRTEYSYDNQRQLTEIRYPDGTTELFTYDTNGRRTSSTDRGSRVTNFVYDALGRLVETIAPDSTPTNFADNPRIRREYDAAGRLIGFVDERGNLTQYGYDAAGRQTLIRDALGNLTRNAYNANGEVITVTDALNRTTQFVYDSLGRVVETRFPDGTKTITTYDALGRVIAETDQAGITTQFEYDALDRLTGVVDALGQRTEYGYDAEGNLITQKDAKANITTYQYNDVNQRLATILPLGQRSTQTYDAVGNVTSVTDFNGKTITYRYNSNDQIIRESFADGTSVNYTYTPTLQRSTVMDSRGVTTYAYDERDQLTARTEADGRTIRYTYDIAGNRTSVITPAGIVGYTYDALNRMQTVTDRSGGATKYIYDKVGNLVRTELPNNTVETRQYDSLDRLISVEQRGASGVIAGYEYTLGLAGNRLAVNEANGRQVNYTYDKLYRLVQEAISDATAGNRTISYTYDAVGNRLNRNDSTEGLTTYTYDDNDRLLKEIFNSQVTDYTYDENGSTLSVKVNGTDQVNYRWDDQGRLIGADIVTVQGTQRIEYRYDADGNRVAVIVNGEETRYLVDTEEAYAQVVEEYKPDGTTEKSYVHGLDLISQDQQGQQSIHHAGALGSINALTDSNGNVTDRYVYDAFGRLIGQQGNTDNDFGFTGEQFDENSDLYYLRARSYNPENGRFISRDSFEGFQDDPQSLHKYTYVHNNPVNLVDPSGNIASIELGGILQRISLPVTLALAGGAAFALLTPEQKAQLARATVAAVKNISELQEVVNSAFRNGGLVFGTLVALEAISKALQNLPDAPPDKSNNGNNGNNNNGNNNNGNRSDSGGSRSQGGTSGTGSASNTGRPPEDPEKDPNNWKPLTPKEAKQVAEGLGFKQVKDYPMRTGEVRNQDVFQKGRNFITRDITGHKGGVWKKFDSAGNRIGTYNQNLTQKIGK